MPPQSNHFSIEKKLRAREEKDEQGQVFEYDQNLRSRQRKRTLRKIFQREIWNLEEEYVMAIKKIRNI
jgi:hypothetical protein